MIESHSHHNSQKEEIDHKVGHHTNFAPSEPHHFSHDNQKGGYKKGKFDHAATIITEEKIASSVFINKEDQEFLEMLTPQEVADKLKIPDDKSDSILKEYRVLKRADHSKNRDHYLPVHMIDSDDPNKMRTRAVPEVIHKTYVNTGKYPVSEKNKEDIQNHFLHAHYITDPLTKVPERFISSESPKEVVIPNFLRLIFFKKIALVVMICQMHELDTTEVTRHSKCSRYFPSTMGESLTFGDYIIKNVNLSEDNGYSVKRTFKISLSEAARKHSPRNFEHFFHHLHIYKWQDMTAPDLASVETAFLEVDQAIQKHPKSPVLVHCSAGIGRTGTFESMYFLREQMQKYKREMSKKIRLRKVEPTFSIFRLVWSLKQMREGSVQMDDQYKSLYSYLLELFDQAIKEGYKQFTYK